MSAQYSPMANDDIEMGRVKPKRGAPPEETDYKPVDWKKVLLTPKYIPWHILGVVLLVCTILLTIYHDKAVDKLRPFSEKLRDLPAGWLIPIVILFIISFPPLFGHELVALLCGVVWGLWIGFAIVAAGTFLGEIGTWFAFMYLLRKKAAKLERTNLNYGALARLTRDGGFWIVLLIRLSAIPSHFSTAVFSTCNVKFWHFFVATFLSLPKQLVLVYVGVLLVQQKSKNTIQTIMFGGVFIVTIALGVYIWKKMAAIKKVLLEEQAQRREKRLREEMEEQDKQSAKRRMTEASDSSDGWSQQRSNTWDAPAGASELSEETAQPPRSQTWGVPAGEVPTRQNWGQSAPPQAPYPEEYPNQYQPQSYSNEYPNQHPPQQYSNEYPPRQERGYYEAPANAPGFGRAF